MAQTPSIDVTTRPSDSSAASFSQLRTSLIKVLRNSPESREPICDALELIEALQQRMDSEKHNPDTAAPAQPAAAAREAGSQEYIIQDTPDGPFLAERRPSGAQPFRCPKPTYEAAAQVVARATDPLHFDDLLNQLSQALGERQAEYRLRVCLRFWLHHKLVQRFRTRYRATDPGTFVARAAKLWETLKAAHSPGAAS